MNKTMLTLAGIVTAGTLFAESTFTIYEGWIPGPNSANNKTQYDESNAALIFAGADINDIRGLRADMGGSWLGSGKKGHGYIYNRTDSAFDVEFQVVDDSFTKVTKCHFFQGDDGVYAYGINSGNVYNTSKYGSVVDVWLEVSTATDNGNYGVYNVEESSRVITDFENLDETYTLDREVLVLKAPAEGASFASSVTGDGEVWVEPAVAAETVEWDAYTPYEYTTVLENTVLQAVDVTAATMGGAWHNTSDRKIPLTLCHYEKSTDKISFQAQAFVDDWVKGLYVELIQDGTDVKAGVRWARYKSGDASNIGDDLASSYQSAVSVVATDDGAGYGLSSMTFTVKPSLTLSGATKTWTWGPTATTIKGEVAVAVSEACLPDSTATELSDGAELRLDVAGGAYWGGDSRSYTIEANSHLYANNWLAIASGATTVVDGGTLHLLTNGDGWTYQNNLTLTNGGKLTGGTPRVGFAANATWTFTGTEPILVESGVLFYGGDKTLTINTEIEGTIAGGFTDAYYYTGLNFVKSGSATLTLKGETSTSGSMAVAAGTMIFANELAIKESNAFTLTGGSVALADDVAGVAAGALTLGGDAAIDLTNRTLTGVTAPLFSFADSSAQTWTADTKLSITTNGGKFARGNKLLRFGTDANGLTSDQLRQISIDGASTALTCLDEEGYLYLENGLKLLIR